MVDPVGTCHLVGCPGKGVHPPHTLKNSLDWLAQLGAELEEKANRTAEWMRDMTEPIADKTFIGAGEWRDYRPAEYCIGVPIAIAIARGGPYIHVECSIGGDIWSKSVSNIDPVAWAALVDDHRASCPNRKVRPDA